MKNSFLNLFILHLQPSSSVFFALQRKSLALLHARSIRIRKNASSLPFPILSLPFLMIRNQGIFQRWLKDMSSCYIENEKVTNIFNVTSEHHRSLRSKKIFAYLMKIYYEIKEKSVNIKKDWLNSHTSTIQLWRTRFKLMEKCDVKEKDIRVISTHSWRLCPYGKCWDAFP